MRLLLVEDDSSLAAVIQMGLAEEGFDVTREATAESGRARAVGETFEAIILDLMLPGGTGIDVCLHLREHGVTAPVLMLTARDSVDDRVRAINAGADAYLTKPFAFRELVAHLGALTHRQPASIANVLRVADLEVDLRSHHVRRADRAIELTANEFALLELLLRHRDQVVERAALSAQIWHGDDDQLTRVVDVLVRRLRRKLDDGFALKLLHAAGGAGYRLSE